MSEYRAYMQNTKLHNGTKRKKRRHRFLFGVLLSALLITGALYGREYDISQLKNIEVMEKMCIRDRLYMYYQLGFEEYNMGQATAVAVVMIIITVLLSTIQFYGSKKWVNY